MARLATSWKQPFEARVYELSPFLQDVLEYNPDPIRHLMKESYLLRRCENARRIYE